jgi:hypothetical protein
MKIIRILRWAGLGIIILTGALWDLYPLPDASPRLNSLPAGRAGAVELTDIELEPGEQINFKDIHAIKRFAVVGPDHVVLLVADGTHNRHAIHDPVFCFRGAGWEIANSAPISLPHGTAQFAKLRRKDGTTAEVVYWFTDGTVQFANPLKYWWKTALRRMTFGLSGSEPLLVILSTTGDPPASWPDLLRQWPALRDL